MKGLLPERRRGRREKSKTTERPSRDWFGWVLGFVVLITLLLFTWAGRNNASNVAEIEDQFASFADQIRRSLTEVRQDFEASNRDAMKGFDERSRKRAEEFRVLVNDAVEHLGGEIDELKLRLNGMIDNGQAAEE